MRWRIQMIPMTQMRNVQMEVASITQSITMAVVHATNKGEAALIAARRNVYWLAKEELVTL